MYVAPGGKKDSEGKTAPRSLRYFPIKGEDGKVDLPHLRNALARIPQAKLPEGVKKRVLAKARTIAKNAGLKTSEAFLDESNCRFPLFGEHILETVIAFNSGEVYEYDYTLEDIEEMGKRLARVLTVRLNKMVNDNRYDENGNDKSAVYDNATETETRYEYQDGQIIVVRSKYALKDATEWEYSDAATNDEEAGMITGGESSHTNTVLAEILEAKHVGDLIKSLRHAKRMTREKMASNMKMTMARLSEIEEGAEPNEEEFGEIAGALNISKTKMGRMKQLADEIATDEEAETTATKAEDDGFIEIEGWEDYEIEDIEIEDAEITVEDKEQVESETEQEKDLPKLFEFAERGLNPDTGCLETRQRLNGRILVEEVRSNGMFKTMRFTSPMLVVDAYTANGNKYDRHCAEMTVRDINRMAKSGKASEDTSRVLAINFEMESDSEDEVEVFDMQLTHNARMDPQKENELKIIAGKIVGAFLQEEEQTVYIVGETIATTAGHDATVMIEEGLLKYISLVSIPKKKHYEANRMGGLDVHEMKFFGADFTRNPAMPFKKGDGIKKMAV